MFNDYEEIKKTVTEGRTVYWKSLSYEVRDWGSRICNSLHP